jgi:hypothetical protein
MNPTLKRGIDVTTVAGASVLLVNSALEMAKTKDVKGIIFPLVGVFVAVAAINYAVNSIKEESISTAYQEIEL